MPRPGMAWLSLRREHWRRGTHHSVCPCHGVRNGIRRAAALFRALLSDPFEGESCLGRRASERPRTSAIACSKAFEAARLFSSPVFKICISSAAANAQAAARFYGLFLWPDAEAEGTKATLNPFAFWGACFRVYGQQFYPLHTSRAWHWMAC